MGGTQNRFYKQDIRTYSVRVWDESATKTVISDLYSRNTTKKSSFDGKIPEHTLFCTRDAQTQPTRNGRHFPLTPMIVILVTWPITMYGKYWTPRTGKWCMMRNAIIMNKCDLITCKNIKILIVYCNIAFQLKINQMRRYFLCQWWTRIS